MDDAKLETLQLRIDIRFKNIETLKQALTHRSAAGENSLESNERLEFLGDSVIGLVVCENLLRLFPTYSEGELAKAKAYIVSETALADAARAMGLEEFVEMSAGEVASGGRRRRSIVADAFEALVAAIYLDCGIRAARRFVRASLAAALREVAADRHHRDYKSSLQEIAQASARLTPVYRIVQEVGRDHEKTFTAQAVIGEAVIGEGTGNSKKEAEQAAALKALDRIADSDPSVPVVFLQESAGIECP